MGSEGSHSSIDILVEELKQQIFFQEDLSSVISVSAYDTAWVAIIPDVIDKVRPMFPDSLAWILENQKEDGFWGETILAGTLQVPTIDCITSTLACIVACKVWNVGQDNIKKGLGFIRANAEKILNEYKGETPLWFSIVLPGMLEIAASHGVHVFPESATIDFLNEIYNGRERGILQMKEKSRQGLFHYPLLSYLEVLPETSGYLDKEIIMRQQSDDGSLFHSPSASAAAFMFTGNEGFLRYLRAAVGSKAYQHGVAGIYPIDMDMVKMCLVDYLNTIGCSEHFEKEIVSTLAQIYRNWINEDEGNQKHQATHSLAYKLYKDSLTFRLLRLNGYDVSPRRFCSFLNDKKVVNIMEENSEYFENAMHSIHKASELAFLGESDLDKARIFSEKMLRSSTHKTNWRDSVVVRSNFRKQYDHELRHPWITRMNHLEHRHALTVGRNSDTLWASKASFYKLAYLNNTSLLQLAKENFTLRQSLFRQDLEQVKRWSKEEGLSTIGFGREKTTYCYFLMSSNSFKLHLSEARTMVTKCAVLVTVADDFYDEEGTIDELIQLTEAVRRWECKGLCGSGKIIFEALNALVEDISTTCYERTRRDVKDTIKLMWREAFEAWLQEAIWSKSEYVPSQDEYLKVGAISIAITAMVLPACYIQCPQPDGYLNYDRITLLTMYSSRMLNDTQSFKKEKEAGKLNMVTLYLEENPDSTVGDILPSIHEMIKMMTREALELILVDDVEGTCLPEAWKNTHLTMLKAFHMLFCSTNLYDSPTALLKDIQDAIQNSIL